jgi:hypothetical protein
VATFRTATLEVTADTVEASPATRLMSKKQPVKKGATLTCELMSVVASSEKVTHLNLSAITVDSVDYLGSINGTFSGTNTIVEAGAAGDIWKYPQVTKTMLSFTGEILITASTGGAQALLTDAWANNVSGLAMILSFTINGVAVTLPMVLTSCSQPFTDGDVQKANITLEGASPDSGSYPTAPTGTTSLLEKALNVATTAVAITFTTHATEGMALTSTNAVFQSFSIPIQDGQLINASYTFAIQGQPTNVAN